MEGLQNEKYICLDFAWISRAVGWIASWIDIGLAAVVLVARLFLCICICMGALRGVCWRLSVGMIERARLG